MPDEKRYTERDLNKAQRNAFVDGAICWAVAAKALGVPTPYHNISRAEIERDAAAKFPLPLQTRPRVVTDYTREFGGVEWRFVGGVLQFRFVGETMWQSAVAHRTSGMFVYPARIRLLAELLANPTEPVPDEEG